MPSPRDDALFVPSRTTEHARTFVSWPCREELWGGFLSEAEEEYAAVVEAIAGFEPVTVIVSPGAVPRLPVGTTFPIDVAELPIDDSWVRDNGPIFVVDGRGGVAAVHFEFNAWGGKYAPFADDARLPARLGQLLGMRVYEAPLVAEGGGLTFDGEGTLITTESVLLNPNRNPGPLARGDRGAAARLSRDREGDLAARRPRRGSRHRRALRQHHAVRAAGRRARPGRARPLQSQLGGAQRQPGAAAEGDRRRRATSSRSSRCPCCRTWTSTASSSSCRTPTTTPSTAASSRRCSGTRDDEAGFALLRELFPDREVVGAPSRLLAYGGGGIGCITQQLPAGMALAPGA